jgi:hypothetical protein
MVPKKGLDLPNFRKSFSLNKIAIVTEYTRFANFSILSIRLTASDASISLYDRRTPNLIGCSNFWTPRTRAYTVLVFQETTKQIFDVNCDESSESFRNYPLSFV